MYRFIFLFICSVVSLNQYDHYEDLGDKLKNNEWQYEFGSKGVGQEIYEYELYESEIGSTEEDILKIIHIQVNDCTRLTYVRVVVEGLKPSKVYLNHSNKKEVVIKFRRRHSFSSRVYAYGYTDDHCLAESPLHSNEVTADADYSSAIGATSESIDDY